YVLNCELRREFEHDETDPVRDCALLEQAQTGNVEMHQYTLGYAIKGNLDRRLQRLAESTDDNAILARTAEIAEVVRLINIEVNLWKTQNLYFRLRKELFPEKRAKAEAGDTASQEWLLHFDRLGDHLGFLIS